MLTFPSVTPSQTSPELFLTWSMLWFIWYCRMASQRFQNVYSGHRTGWNTKQEWEVWESGGRGGGEKTV